MTEQSATSPVPGSGGDPLETLRYRLQRLHLTSGKPSTRAIARTTHGAISHTTVSYVLRCDKSPKWGQLELVVEALGGNVEEFRAIWVAVEDMDRRMPSEPPDAVGRDGELRAVEQRPADTERERYLRALAERYRRLDLEVLTPVEQEEHPPVLLRSIFVPQHVRAEPPLVELPKELWQRLVEVGETGIDSLPDGMDVERMTQVRAMHQERPPRQILTMLADATQPRVVLLGDPGAGKSTLARYTALMLARGAAQTPLHPLAGWLPVLVELRTYADTRWRVGRWRDGTFLDLVDHLHATEGLGLPKEVLDAYLREDGRAVVIFDGLDELFDAQIREVVTHQIAAFATRYPKVRIVVTSRVIGYRRSVLDASGFAHHTIQDFGAEHIESFVERWYELIYGENPAEAARRRDRLLAAVARSASVRELAVNPLLLTILAIIGRRRELPRERWKVYAHAASVLVEHWDINRHLHDARVDMAYVDYDDKVELLRRIARRMQTGRGGLAGNHIPGADLLAEFSSYLHERYQLPPEKAKPVAKAMLEQLRERNFILSRFGAVVYGFVHRAFLEYFSAADIVHRFRDERLLTPEELTTDVFGRYWSDSAWQEVLLLVTGMLDERFAGQVIDHLVRDVNQLWFLDPEEPPRNLLLAIRCFGETRKLSLLTRQGRLLADAVIAVLETVHERLTSRFDPSGAWATLDALHQMALPVFQSVGPHWPSRGRYLDWFSARGRLLTSSVTPGLVSLSSVAAFIAGALFCDDTRVRDLLREQTTFSGQPELRQAAVQALAAEWHEDPGTGPLLRERATTDEDAAVRRAAVQALALSWPDDPDVGAWLRERALTDAHPYVRQAAVQALAAGWRDDPEIGAWLRERALTDSHPYVRQAAVQALTAGWRDDPEVGRLIRQRVTDEDMGVRQTAVQALAAGWHSDPDSAVLLRERATIDEHPYVRQAAVRALATSWRDNSDIGLWLRERAAVDAHPYVRQAAVATLSSGWQGDPDTGILLRERATVDDNAMVRRAAVRALGARWRDDPGTEALLHQRATVDDDAAVRRAAVQALAAGWGGEDDTGRLLRERAVADTHPYVRQTAVQALAVGWGGDHDTGRLLRERAVADTHPYVRQTALRALAAQWHDSPDTCSWLRSRAGTDKHWAIRRAAVQALATGWRDDPDIGKWLRESAGTSEHPDVRHAAVQALAAGWREDPQTTLWLRERATVDEHPDVRHAAAQAVAFSGG
jgi:HEAT repeat protein